MTPDSELNPTCTEARPFLLPLRKPRLRGKEQGRWRGRLPGVTQVKAASLLVTAPHARARDSVFLSFLGGRGAAQGFE